MKTKKFHLGDVLSIIMDVLVSPQGFIGVHHILSFMVDEDLMIPYGLPRACQECRPYLIKQFPQLATPKMNLAVTSLTETVRMIKGLKTKRGKAKAKKITADWLAYQVTQYGEMFAVKPIPKGAHQFMNPVEEVVEAVRQAREEERRENCLVRT